MCVPVFPWPLKNRMPVTYPSAAGTNLTPTSTFEVSLVAVTSGTSSPKREHGHETLMPTDAGTLRLAESSLARTLMVEAPRPLMTPV